MYEVDLYDDEACLFGVHSSCWVVELCYRRVHIGKRRCHRLPRTSNDQVHVVKQGILGLHVDSNSHKLKRPKKLTSRWSVLTRCEKTGQHTLHICKTDNPDSSVKESYPVQTSWSIKSAHCLKSTQRMDIFKEEGFIIHMGRQIVYVTCSSRSEVKSWICAILEGVTLGFEYHCRCEHHTKLGVSGECMLVLSPECVALVCPLTGAPLRKWPYFLLTSIGIVDNMVCWTTEECDVPFRASVNQHNVLTLYNVLCRYLAHTNPNVQVKISISKQEPKACHNKPAENKYTTRHLREESPPVSGLCNNMLYQSQDTCSSAFGQSVKDPTYELMSSNHSDYSTGVSSTASTYESDVYEYMESSEPSSSDCIYEDMNNCSPLTDDGYITSSSLRFHNGPSSRSVNSFRPPSSEVYMNMEPAKNSRIRPAYEYVDIEFNESTANEPAPPQLPTRKKLNNECSDRAVTTDSSSARDITPLVTRNVMATRDATPLRDHPHVRVTTIPKEKLSEGLKSFQEQAKLEKEMILSFSAAVLDSNNSDGNLQGNSVPSMTTSKSRTFMNSAV